MQLDNLTPFAALGYAMQDVRGQHYRVVAIKVGYAIEHGAGGQSTLRVLDDKPVALTLADEHYGEAGLSSVRRESDLAPFKPRCDVIVLGHAHAPDGRPAQQWPVRLRLSAPTGATLLDKSLAVSAPHTFRKGLMGWRIDKGTPVVRVPLRWEHSLGGTSRVPNPRHPMHPDEAQYLLDEVCLSNPLGCGWFEQRFFKLADKAGQALPEAWPAPCVLSAGTRFEAPLQVAHPHEELDAAAMARVARDYPRQPAGFGFLGRAWAPRLARAGTYDAHWQDTRWPALPEDFDFAYWNGAPEDQQIDWPPPDTTVELWNLLDPARAPHGHVRLRLPGHRAFVMAWLAGAGGAPVPLPMNAVIDTFVIDADEGRIELTWRCLVPEALPLERLEARFETDPTAPLLKLSHEPVQETPWPTT